MAAPLSRRTFPWPETRSLLVEADRRWSFTREGQTQRFVSTRDPGVVFTPPLVLPLASGVRDAADYLADLPERPGRQVLLLLQAGASALGLWDGDELLAHKAIKKYVVRGSGRAQTTHLRTRGKSRYGSRLRLQNAKRLAEETIAKVREWEAAHGPFHLVLYGATERAWAELFRFRPPPPFDQRDDRCRRIPLDVRVPCFEELKRIRRHVTRGSTTAPS